MILLGKIKKQKAIENLKRKLWSALTSLIHLRFLLATLNFSYIYFTLRLSYSFGPDYFLISFVGFVKTLGLKFKINAKFPDISNASQIAPNRKVVVGWVVL